jgi:hypothetical protein
MKSIGYYLEYYEEKYDMMQGWKMKRRNIKGRKTNGRKIIGLRR